MITPTKTLYSENGYLDPALMFTREFCEEFTRRTGRLLRKQVDPSILRYDPDIIELVDLRGALWSAAPNNKIGIVTIPIVFRPFYAVLRNSDSAVDSLSTQISKIV